MKICNIEGCEKKVIARGWCHTHYKRWQVHKNPEFTKLPRGRVCQIEECNNPHSAKGYCAMHRKRIRAHGQNITKLNKFLTFLEAYNFYVVKKNGCWGWNGSINNKGYGQLFSQNKIMFIHRFSYEHHYGPLKHGELVCHKCDNPICSNPEHLFKGTQKDNMRDCINKKRFVKVKNKYKAKGGKVGGSKLTENEVIQIKQLLKNGYSNKELAILFKVTDKNISSIKLNKTWKHIKGVE